MGMVTDFGRIKAVVERWVNDELDHKLLLHARDPLVPVLTRLGQPVVRFPDNPTAENISRLIYQRARRGKLPVLHVRLWETQNSYAQYPAAML
jgi:6-pyruvoyltetrahydropterin/6-carboxytetrahydropterin synthase